jgi:hypothetical protein
MIPVILLTTRIGRGRRPFFFFLSFLPFDERNGVSLMLRLGVLG